LASLLGIGISGRQKPEVDPLAGELLEAQLASTLPLDSLVADTPPAVMGRSERERVPLSGRPLGEVLLDSATDLTTIRGIKDYGKKLAGRKDSGADHAVGIAIYYAAIASAMVFHEEKITQHSFRSLADAFDTLRQKPWVPSELSRHFLIAHGYCIEKNQSA
jgi:hypothetical protein